MQSQEHHSTLSQHTRAASSGRGNLASQAIIQLVSSSENIPIAELLHATRSAQPIAEARKLAMYLIHVCSGLNLTETGMIFGRDRTTVRHACACVEDHRDDRVFDERVILLEERIAHLPETHKAHQ